MTSPIMNMSQNYPYLAQSPQMYQQLGTTPSQPPPWATAILEEIQCLKTEIQCIKQVLPQIDNIEKTVSKINAKVIDLERKSTDLDKRVDIIEASCQTMSDIVEQNKSNMLNVNSNLKETQKNISQLETDMKTMNKQMENYNNKALENEAKAMKDSLIFYGFEEDPGLTRNDESSNCEELLREFLGKFLLHEDEVGKIEIDNIYRVGRDTARKPRPILVKFHYYKQRENIRKNAFENREAIKRAGYGVGIQQPKEIRDARKALYPIMKTEEAKGKRTYFIGKKLYINGEEYNDTTLRFGQRTGGCNTRAESSYSSH
jgi:hypothetical protein